LEQRAVELGARLVARAALQRLRRLADHQVDARAQAAPSCDVRGRFDDNNRLVEPQAAVEPVVGAQTR
jgi:hypothetical protein